MKKDMSEKYLQYAILFYKNQLCDGLLWYAYRDTVKGCLTLPQQQKLANLDKKYKKLSPWPVTLNGYFERLENFKELADNLIEFYADCYPLLQTHADKSLASNAKRVAWRWRNILATAKQFRTKALHHEWSEVLDIPLMHHTEWWHL